MSRKNPESQSSSALMHIYPEIKEFIKELEVLVSHEEREENVKFLIIEQIDSFLTMLAHRMQRKGREDYSKWTIYFYSLCRT